MAAGIFKSKMQFRMDFSIMFNTKSELMSSLMNSDKTSILDLKLNKEK